MTRKEIALRLASRYDSRYLRGYVRTKVAADPVYEAVADWLRDHPLPLVDLGCGVGLMAFYLRETGFRGPLTGIDFDPRKIAAAQAVAERYALNVTFRTADARAMLPEDHSVIILDVLQYMDRDSQQLTLRNAARAVPSGGVVIIRAGIRDASWRYRLSWLSDTFGRATRWMRAERLAIPTRDDITSVFADAFDAEVTPLWGRTPFNNYLFVFHRRS